MAKVFYGLQNDIVDRQIGNNGLLDILQNNKCIVYTELPQLKGEKIDVAYIEHDMKLLSQISDLQIKKISILSKNEDDIVVPKNYVKYSSDGIVTKSGKLHNIILNRKDYKTDTEILIIGNDDPQQDVIRNVYTLYGNVITNTLGKCITPELANTVKSRNLPNSGGVYYVVHSVLDGLNKCTIRKNIIKVRPNEHFFDLNPIIASVQNDSKIVLTNISVRKVSAMKFSIGDHLIAGKYEQLSTMYGNAMNILNNKVAEMRKRLRLEYNLEQLLTVGYLRNMIDYLRAKDDAYVKELLAKHFIIIPIDELGQYRIPIGNNVLASGKQFNKDLYAAACEVKTVSDI